MGYSKQELGMLAIAWVNDEMEEYLSASACEDDCVVNRNIACFNFMLDAITNYSSALNSDKTGIKMDGGKTDENS